ncbi:hypothetical protein [Nocardia salmonicida]|uniref:hypothetical protein n=1 Tax=Nocardia salmonicida TaxID=53431 RepID=UPI000ADE72CC|nr:hypothetical protein [Nocardia salmonicida]
MLHQREGYWETRKEPTWSRGWMFDADNTRNVLHAEGVLGSAMTPVCVMKLPAS